MKISDNCYKDVIKHSLKFGNYNTFGALIGDTADGSVVKRVEAISHTNINPCITETYLEICGLRLKQNEKIIGFYESKAEDYDLIPDNQGFSILFMSFIKSYTALNKDELLLLSVKFNNNDDNIVEFNFKKYSEQRFKPIDIAYDVNRIMEMIDNDYMVFQDIEEIINLN